MWTLLLALALFPQHHQGPPHSFEDAERWAEEFESPERLAWQKPDEVVRALELSPGARVADIGAGSGYFSRRFASAVGDSGVVYAIDIEPNMLRYLAARAEKDGAVRIVPVLATPTHPMIPPGSVDLVFICNTIHHIGERARYYGILKRVLTPGGRLVIVDFEKKEGIPVGPPPEMRIAREDLVGEVTAAGFRLARDVSILPYQYFLIFSAP
jgi:ubiquinone/menaquinone biosynthesis C-methylase UbiE